MRHYAPASVEAVLAELLEEPSLARGVVHHEVIPARTADLAALPDWLDPGIRAGLASRGIDHLYRHQAEAVELVRAGHDVVVVTPTASGKTLCYALPILQALADDPSARALLLFPTKALGQDQVAEFGALATASGLGVTAATYDGDTPAPVRNAIRTAGQIVVSNPDMLHSGILPHHTKWFQLFEQLRIIVIDELHTYRGIFGSHVANVLRRLLRLCAHYGSKPVIVCCSATIGNPADLAATLTGRPARLVNRNGAPSGERHVLLVDPPVLDPASGARGSALTLANRWALPFLRAGRQTVVFGRSRTSVELLLTGLREALREGHGPRTLIRGYRGGYLPTERRSIERGLRDGELLGVVSTNALELGVDIGRLDVSVLAGYPGSIAATWQQMGRAGRRQGVSVSVLVASGAPVDQYVIHHPEFLLAGSPEEARLDPDNLHVLLAHLRAAVFELPFEPGEPFGPAPADDLLAFLAEEGHVRQAGDGRWYWSSENFPASAVSLRTAAQENVVIIDTTPDRPRVIGEVDLFAAQTLVHENAIYLHELAQFHVDRLDWDERKAYVRRVDVDHYTEADRAVTLKPLDVFAEEPATGGSRVHGEVMVASLATIYKKLKFVTNENLGWGRIHLPEIELQTTAYWLTARDLGAWNRRDLDLGLLGAGRAIQTIASVLLMVDPRDLGLVSQVRSPHQEAPTIYLYESVPGGVGLSERLWQRHDELLDGAAALIRNCGCEGGCPSCTGPRLEPEIDVRALALRLLGHLGAGRPLPLGCEHAVSDAALLQRRLASLRHQRGAAAPSAGVRPADRLQVAAGGRVGQPSRELADRLASAIDGQVVAGPLGSYVLRDVAAVEIPIDRWRLSLLPGQPPPDVPLICLDTETTGLATAAGTLAFLVGVGWWDGRRFCQRQLLLPDHADEPAWLAALAAVIPAAGWLVTYNGRTFDWPLLVARFRMARRGPPPTAGHLDLLPIVRRLFRHRLADARLRSAEEGLLGLHRTDDVEGWEIPGRYLSFLRGGSADVLLDVVRHNELDVRSMAQLLAHLDEQLADPERRVNAPAGDLVGLARSFGRERRHAEALTCLEQALAARSWAGGPVAAGPPALPAREPAASRAGWWPGGLARITAPAAAFDRDRILAERARLLRRTGRVTDATAAWRELAHGGSRLAGVAWVEIAKIAEHQLRDPAGALLAVGSAEGLADRSRQLGRPLPALEADLVRRRRRLSRRVAARSSAGGVRGTPGVGVAAAVGAAAGVGVSATAGVGATVGVGASAGLPGQALGHALANG